MSKRSEAMRIENERVKRQTEQRLARKREKEMQVPMEADEEEEEKPLRPQPPRAKSSFFRNTPWGIMGVIFVVLLLVAAVITGVNHRAQEAAGEEEGEEAKADSDTKSPDAALAEGPGAAEQPAEATPEAAGPAAATPEGPASPDVLAMPTDVPLPNNDAAAGPVASTAVPIITLNDTLYTAGVPAVSSIP
eukprot:CAMPEP_0118923434 /NCGR_PEP_ID=MMETSP1169-20130426/1964_1 /TAXON_ID=36882 /ORGANISM="Pyramimonas obovata, Strain CCMP722" /LENGTH=190 /DNA_ID=CAMNT_0006864415 /DNA_START=156 /DNA_END=724 /DNA_ORIENTATION=+